MSVLNEAEDEFSFSVNFDHQNINKELNWTFSIDNVLRTSGYDLSRVTRTTALSSGYPNRSNSKRTVQPQNA